MQLSVAFSHVHLYVDNVDDLRNYKKYEQQLNDLWQTRRLMHLESSLDSSQQLSQARDVWNEIMRDESSVDRNSYDKPTTMKEVVDSGEFSPQNRDVVKQMLAGFGFRITGARYPGLVDDDDEIIFTNTRSVLLTSRDPNGAQVLVTAIDPNHEDAAPQDNIRHFDASKVRSFYQEHNNRQGIAVLAFLVDDVESARDRYKLRHPNLFSDYNEYKEMREGETVLARVLEVFAFYREHQDGGTRQADGGTVLRFMQMSSRQQGNLLPGLQRVDATFDDYSLPAYCDHWVSNVASRTEFLDTLHETLGFDVKVDFNAGVVAAGEAQIESTVAGNSSVLSFTDEGEALRDQSQVFLPINNALSQVGHVHLFLEEIGQGVQHVASRVNDLVSFVQQVNDQRRITREGFTFLQIPRSYYGVLTLSDLEEVVPSEFASEVVDVLDQRHLLALDGAVDLNLSYDTLDAIFKASFKDSKWINQYESTKDELLPTILQSRYKNLHSLLRDHVSEKKYLGIVRNQILVDIQGEDLLYQIFTCNILQRNANEEAPFFEFIQRVCSECQDKDGCPQKLRPGCGGFGIRNFLTLFLSIEVSKAMQGVADARAVGDKDKQAYEQKRVDYFTAQLNESNPILTEISDAMTCEGHLREKLAVEADPNEKDSILVQIQEAAERKRNGNRKLMEVSAKYNDLMKTQRMQR